MQCPACGATNPDSAQWCGQCLQRFGQQAAPTRAPAPSSADPAPFASATQTPPAPSTAPSSEGFRRDGGNLQWECPSCGQFNDIDDLHCVICGTAFTERFRAAPEPEPPRNWSAALAMSAVAPGAGHMSVGRYGSGLARLTLFLIWMAGALMLGIGGGRGAMLAVAPLFLGAIAVWAGTLVDVQRLSQAQEELLVGRRLLYLVIGVLVLLGAGLLISAVRLLP